ncbi:ataxin-10 [Pogonomyrmex barbatus]|uniref:Ataxin-10 n=1 Tax=Pogonomyrmex barbatus TaxID=144034 RepID=A0A6I9XKK1_9HYME|nr:ataxin-10 [Pogonomyrmex barbatus]
MTAHITSQKLKIIINENNWDQLLQEIKPKHFVRQESGIIPDAGILAQLCQILVSEITLDMIKILCLKCLGNSCLDSYKHKQHTIRNVESVQYSKNLYDELVESDLCQQGKNCDYPHDSHFPYDGVVEWTVYYIKSHDESMDCLTDKELDIFRLSIQFLCNLFTYACPNVTSADNILRYINCDNFKQVILNSMQSDYKLLASAACIYVHNALKKLPDDHFTNDEKNLYLQLIKPAKENFTSAKDALLFLLQRRNIFENIYSSIAISEKLELLEIIYNEVWTSWQSDLNTVLTEDQAEFLTLTFCKKSDLILKTVDTYVNSIDPTEVILILNILGLITTQYKISKNARSLLINCKYLLMSLHMMGKEADNYFTPITNLSKVAPSAKRTTVDIETNDIETSKAIDDLQEHPAYGFKAGLIQVIANIVHKNKICQDLFREIDGIPLLLDCCNIDARNPLILQWTILALRNLCEGNPENQEIIRNCEKKGVPDNPALQEMGLTLHEDADGKSIRIAPLRRN